MLVDNKSRGSSANRRTEVRKAPSGNMPAQVIGLPADVLPDQFPQVLKRSPRRIPKHQIKVILSHSVVEEASIINMSKQGLLIRNRQTFSKGQKLNLSFLIEDELQLQQVPIYAICEVVWTQHDLDSERFYQIGLSIIYMLSEHSHLYCQYIDRLPLAPQINPESN